MKFSLLKNLFWNAHPLERLIYFSHESAQALAAELALLHPEQNPGRSLLLWGYFWGKLYYHLSV